MPHPEPARSFHLLSKNPQQGFGGPYVKTRPEEWKKTYYKSYPRFPKIKLSVKTDNNAALFSVLKKRVSTRDFSPKPISLSHISGLLGAACGETHAIDSGKNGRSYPSGGAQYPIEMYLITFRDGDMLPSGVYHYHPGHHHLDILKELNFTKERIEDLFTALNFKNPGAMIALTAVLWRSQQKYSERGYRMCLLEAGHIGQNILLVAEALSLSALPMSGVCDRKVEALLGIDGVEESLVHAVLLGI